MCTDIQVISVNEAIRKRPYMYVGESDSGLNVVVEVICYAVDVVMNGGEAEIIYGDGSSNDPFIVSTYGSIELDLDKAFELYAGKCDSYRHGQLGITKALCKRFKISNKTKCLEYEYSGDKEEASIRKLVYAENDRNVDHEVHFSMVLDLNIVDRVPYKKFIEYLSKNPHFNWSICNTDAGTFFKGKL
jgi:hypothetical protein